MQSTTNPPAATSRTPKVDARAGKYLTFLIGKEEFGVAVLKVREIMGILDITAVPQTPWPTAIRVCSVSRPAWASSSSASP